VFHFLWYICTPKTWGFPVSSKNLRAKNTNFLAKNLLMFSKPAIVRLEKFYKNFLKIVIKIAIFSKIFIKTHNCNKKQYLYRKMPQKAFFVKTSKIFKKVSSSRLYCRLTKNFFHAACKKLHFLTKNFLKK